jgi:diguanylate cyclase (GGDEF)-like protein/PAS domain S-box-containing protein
MDDTARIRHLEEQVLYLLEEKRAALSALEMAATLGNFETSLNQLDDPTVILHETANRVRTLARLKAVSFFLVDEDDSRFYQAYCDPASRGAAFEREVDALIEDKTFAWALGRNKAVMVTSLAGEQLMLHALSTSSRTRGIFLGVLDQDKSEILDTALMLFTVILLASAHALESFELYRRNREITRELEQNLARLRLSEAQLKRSQETLEEQVLERTAALAETNQQLAGEIRERKAAEKEIRKLSQAVIHSPSLILITDAAGTIEYVNPKFTQVTGYPAEEAVGQKPSILRSGRHDREYYAQMWETIAAGQEWRGEICNRTKDGREYWAMTSISPIVDPDGAIRHYVGVAEDITKKIVQEEHIKFLALHDSLTGLPNRNLFMDRLNQAISFTERHQSVAVVMYVDLDDFKQVNDQHGHEAGDMVLQEAARRLTRCIRTADSVARVGGDEFVIILQDIREEREIERVAERVLTRFAEPFPVAGTTCRVGASVGIALCPEDGRDVDTLLRKADMAMYSIKRGDKQGFRYFRDRKG